MDSLKLFTERLPALETLPETPKTYWYVSAGDDFRGPVAFTQYHINHELVHHGRDFVKPDLFIYNSVGKEVLELKEKLTKGEVELRSDHSTRLVARNCKSLKLRDEVIFEINENYINSENLNLNDYEMDRAFYFELEVSGHNYCEIQRILYFQAENIDFFHKIILKNIFNIQYLCSTREGLSWGACKKSIVDYIYQDHYPNFFTNVGFKPSFNILSKNFTNKLFEDAVDGSISVEPNYGKFISESEKYVDDSVIYKISY